MLSTRFCFFAHEKGKRLRFPFPVICIDSELLFIIYPHSGTLTQFLIRIPAAQPLPVCGNRYYSAKNIACSDVF